MNVQAYLHDVASAHRRPVLVLANEKMTRDFAFRAIDTLGERDFRELDVVVQTGGGDIDAAYLLARFLRVRCAVLRVFVPLAAKSAGTLVCLAADDLQLSEYAELGPLDAQVFTGTRGAPGRFRSTLNYMKGLEYARRDPHLFARFDSQEMGEYERMLQIGERYGEALLVRYRGIARSRARKMMRRLVYGYPSHSYVLDVDELRDIGLPVSIIDSVQLKALRPMADALFDSGDDVVMFAENGREDEPRGKLLHNVVR